tara:strand:+ start:572 stop:1249 length:678 start_codon:yes stop_codon:yes gene_type:complete
MIIQPIKQAPYSGLTGYGGGSSSLLLNSVKVWVEGTKQDLQYHEKSSLNYDTSGNGGVDVATTNSNNTATALTHQNNTGGWSMGYSATSVDTDRPTSISFYSSQVGNYAFGFGKKFATGTYFDDTVRGNSGAYGIYWNAPGDATWTPGGHGTTISNLTSAVDQFDYIKVTLNPLTSSYEVRDQGTLVQSGTLSASFVTAIQAGQIFAVSDQYSAGYVALHKYPWT